MFIADALLLAFAITVVVEIVVVVVLRRDAYAETIAAVIIINSVTHPIFVAYAIHVFDVPVMIAEVGIVIVETVWYRIALKEQWRIATMYAVAANGCSFVAGYLIA